jgi:hypothetical protein
MTDIKKKVNRATLNFNSCLQRNKIVANSFPLGKKEKDLE